MTFFGRLSEMAGSIRGDERGSRTLASPGILQCVSALVFWVSLVYFVWSTTSGFHDDVRANPDTFVLFVLCMMLTVLLVALVPVWRERRWEFQWWLNRHIWRSALLAGAFALKIWYFKL